MYHQVFCDELTRLLDSSDITTAFFCTTDKSTPSQTSASDSAASEENIPEKGLKTNGVGTTTPLNSAGIEIYPGRPDIRETVMAEAQAARDSLARLAVLTCGPAQMADECRGSVYETMQDGFQGIEYYEEVFGW